MSWKEKEKEWRFIECWVYVKRFIYIFLFNVCNVSKMERED